MESTEVGVLTKIMQDFIVGKEVSVEYFFDNRSPKTKMKKKMLAKGKLVKYEDNMNCHLEDVTLTKSWLQESRKLSNCFIRGTEVVMIKLPEDAEKLVNFTPKPSIKSRLGERPQGRGRGRGRGKQEYSPSSRHGVGYHMSRDSGSRETHSSPQSSRHGSDYKRSPRTIGSREMHTPPRSSRHSSDYGRSPRSSGNREMHTPPRSSRHSSDYGRSPRSSGNREMHTPPRSSRHGSDYERSPLASGSRETYSSPRQSRDVSESPRLRGRLGRPHRHGSSSPGAHVGPRYYPH